MLITGVSSPQNWDPETRSDLNGDPHTPTGAEGGEGPLGLPCGSPQSLTTPPKPRHHLVRRARDPGQRQEVVSALPLRGSTPSPALLARHPQRHLTPESLFTPLPSAFTLQPLGFLFPACWRPVLSAPRQAARDISLPGGPFLGCVGLSLQILPSHDLWSHLSTCFLNFNSCRAQAHVKRNFLSVSSAGPSRPPPWRVQEPQVQRTGLAMLLSPNSPASAANVASGLCWPLCSLLSLLPIFSLCLHLSACLAPPLVLAHVQPLSPKG